MSHFRILALLSVLGLTAALARPQEYYDEDQDEPPRKKQALPPAGFWPTQRMMELFIDRITEEMSNTYDFDEDQLYNTRELFRERIPVWLNDNRGEIMQLTNEYFEALLAGEAPDPKYVADWAGRTLPLFDEFTTMFEGVSDEMRTYLTEDQQVILDGQMAAFHVGVSYLGQRLERWRAGQFDAETEWPGSPEHRKYERERERVIREEAQRAEAEARGDVAPQAGAAGVAGQERFAQPTRPRIEPKDEWTRYVESFVRRYQLTDEQKATAYRHLRFQQEQRDKYLRRTKTRLANARQALQEAETDEQREKAEKEQQRLNRPLERMFTQLKEKLEKIPTRAQRRAAAEATAEADEHQEKADEKSAEKESESQPAGAKRESPSSP